MDAELAVRLGSSPHVLDDCMANGRRGETECRTKDRAKDEGARPASRNIESALSGNRATTSRTLTRARAHAPSLCSRMRREIHEVLDELEAEGGLAPGQAGRIAVRLASRLDAPRDRSGRVISIVAAIGGVLFGAGILYLIGYNWEELGKPTKLALIFGLWAIVHAAGYWLSENPGRSPRVGKALILLGILCFGGAIGLVAQIYNLSARYPWSILLWWALNVPLLLWTRSRAVQVVLTGLFLLWIFWHASVWFEDLGRTGYGWDRGLEGMLGLIAGVSAFFAVLALFVQTTDHARFAAFWRVLAPIGLLVVTYIAGFKDLGLTRVPRADWLPILAPAGLAMLTAVVLVALGSARGARGALRRESSCALALAIVLVGSCLAAPRMMVVLGNLLMLGVILGLVWHGTRERIAGYIHLALGAFALLVITRYIEYLWSKLEGAYIFLSTGALLIALGWFLERRRRSLMARVHGGAA